MKSTTSIHQEDLFDFYLFQFDDGTFAPYELENKTVVAIFNVYNKFDPCMQRKLFNTKLSRSILVYLKSVLPTTQYDIVNEYNEGRISERECEEYLNLVLKPGGIREYKLIKLLKDTNESYTDYLK